MLRRRTIAAVALVVGVATSCIRSTPFQSDPDETNLTARNLAALAKRQAPQPFKFVAFGDTHSDYDNLRRTVDAINARDDIELALITGDMTTFGLLEEFEWANDEYTRLDVPYLTVIGNHDALGHGPEIYRKMFGPFDHSFEFGGIKFVMFNSNTLEFEGAAPDREWLTNEVKHHQDAEGVILVMHHDLTSPDDYEGGTTKQFYRELVQAPGVIGVIHGHLSDLELIVWQGVPVLQTGTYEKVFLHTIVTVNGTELSFEVCHFEQCEPAYPVKESALE